MPSFRFGAAGLALALVATTGVMAQGTRPLDHLTACRLESGEVALRFTFEGGACEQPAEPTVGSGREGVGTVTVPTQTVGEVCTMQVVPVPFEGTIAVADDVTALDITVLAPEGGPQALGSTDIAAQDDPACSAAGAPQ